MEDLILLNDVETELDQYGLLPSNAKVTRKGESQSVSIAKHISGMSIDKVLTSDAQNLTKLIHHIRMNSKNNLNRSVTYTDSLRERDFGVLVATKHPLGSEIFTHSRISPEGGESVYECKTRVTEAIKSFCHKYPKETKLIISHPFVCQMLENGWGNKLLTSISGDWFQKGFYMVVDSNEWKIKKTGRVT